MELRSDSLAAAADDKLIVKIATYNLLSDCYVRVPGQSWNAFEHCAEEDLNWEHRCPKLVGHMLMSDADVLCVQEMTYEFRDGAWGLPSWTESLTGCGYCAVMQKHSQKELSKNADRNVRMVGKQIPTGLATFYRREKFAEICESKHGSGSGVTLFLGFRGSDGRPAGDISVFVSNVHLVGDPSKFDMHIKQLNPLIKNCEVAEEALLSTGGRKAALHIICGDFNGDVYSAHDSGAVSQWFADRSFRRAETGFSWAGHPDSRLRLDHIMYRVTPIDRYNVEEFYCSPTNDLSNTLTSRRDLVLPNFEFPSDHLLVSASFNVTEATAALSTSNFS